jgi:putative phosphoribosyl transferase
MSPPPYGKSMAIFHDRADAGRRLARALRHLRGGDLLVLGIPRGGVPIAAEVAHALSAELDIIVARKAGAPDQPELALGAVTSDGIRFSNADVIGSLGLTAGEVAASFAQAAGEAGSREERLREGRAKPKIEGRTVLLVDDGLATGATLRAAIRSVRRSRPARLIAAVPVGSPKTCEVVRHEVDELVCPERPELFFGIGQFYDSFPQVSDDEVRSILKGEPVAV